MRDLLINPDTNERVQASRKGADNLRDRGWLDASPRNAPSEKDPGRSGIIVQNLRATDYNAASIERIHRFLQSGDAEYALGLLTYERAHRNRGAVVALAQARLRELDTDEPAADAAASAGGDAVIERPHVNAKRDAWDAYAQSLGLDPSQYSSKEDLVDAVDDAEQD